MIHGQGLVYKYPGGNSISFPDFQIDAGSQWLVLGPSGSGKTTLLQLLAGLRKPHEGTIAVHKKALEKLSSSELDQYRGKEIGIVFQKAHFVESISVGENILLSQNLSGNGINGSKGNEILTALGLEEKWNKKPSQLSQGERQRVSLARALAKQPKVILADEPTAALDDANTDRVIELLKAQAKNVGATLIIVTHDQRLKSNFSQKIELS